LEKRFASWSFLEKTVTLQQLFGKVASMATAKKQKYNHENLG
jgi:hypothetical protein